MNFLSYVTLNPEISLEKGKNYPFIEMSNVSKTYRNPMALEEKPYESGVKFQDGDTVIARITPCLQNGKRFYCKGIGVGFGSTEYLVFRPKNKSVDSLYLYYFMQTDFIRQSMINSMSGATGRQRVNNDVFKNIGIDFPDISIQIKIGEILSAYDDLIENNQKQIKLLEEAAQRLYKEWFVDLRFPGHEEVPFVDGLPEGWERKNIEAVCDTIGGGTPSTKVKDYYESGNIPWVTPTDITKNNGLVILKSEKRITKAGLDHSSAKMLPPFTILMTSRASVGFFGISELSVCTNQGFISCVPYNENTRYYLLFNLMNRVEEIRQKSSGSTYMEINKTNFRAFEFVLPEDKVIEQFDFFARNIIRQVAVKAKTIQALQDARDRLLPKLMSGELEL